MFEVIFESFLETLLMVTLATGIGLTLGFPLGTLLFYTSPKGLHANRVLNLFSSGLTNAFRSIPYIILTVFLIPLTRLLTGSSIGTLAAVVPLGISAIFLIARVIEDALKQVPQGLIEVGITLGATHLQIIRKFLIPECLPVIISGITLVVINLIGFSTMAGAVGGGGLGDLAMRYGYQRFNMEILLTVICILITLVQTVQFAGDRLALKARKL
jgi:D-methionine transport system permease protein